MDHLERIAELDRALIVRRSQLGGELDDRELRSLTMRGIIVRVMRGCYMRREVWDGLYEDQRLLARSLCLARSAGPRAPLFSHLSAAAIWGLPLYGLKRSAPERVHTLARPDSPGRSVPSVLRHVAPYDEDEATTVAGLRVTSITRTIHDLARWSSPELAIACADSGLRRLHGGDHARLPDSLGAWREDQLALLGALRGGRGVRGARFIVGLADPRADSPAESVSRLQLTRLGVPFEFQVGVEGLGGAQYWMDFEFLGQRCFGEMDGAIKYTDPAFRRGRSLEQVLLDEKEREDEVRGIHRKSTLRWGWSSIGTARRLGERLAAFGLEVPRLTGAPAAEAR